MYSIPHELIADGVVQFQYHVFAQAQCFGCGFLVHHLPFYHIRKFFSSQYVRWTLRTIQFSVWLISICLTCIIAHDNAKLHTIQKKYVLLREFARQNKEWADKADLIEYLYTDEAEHQEEIQRLWENRHKRLERRETKSIGHP